MIYLYSFTILALLISYLIDKKKGKKSIKIGFKKLVKNLPIFFNMIMLISVTLYFITDDLILKYLGEGNIIKGLIIGMSSGSITLMPGFVAFPFAGVLLEKGVSYTVLAGFTNSLMLVGIMTFPLEKKYFGLKLTVFRNIMGVFLALIVAIVTGIFYGELF